MVRAVERSDNRTTKTHECIKLLCPPPRISDLGLHPASAKNHSLTGAGFGRSLAMPSTRQIFNSSDKLESCAIFPWPSSHSSLGKNIEH